MKMNKINQRQYLLFIVTSIFNRLFLLIVFKMRFHNCFEYNTEVKNDIHRPKTNTKPLLIGRKDCKFRVKIDLEYLRLCNYFEKFHGRELIHLKILRSKSITSNPT